MSILIATKTKRFEQFLKYNKSYNAMMALETNEKWHGSTFVRIEKKGKYEK